MIILTDFDRVSAIVIVISSMPPLVLYKRGRSLQINSKYFFIHSDTKVTNPSFMQGENVLQRVKNVLQKVKTENTNLKITKIYLVLTNVIRIQSIFHKVFWV